MKYTLWLMPLLFLLNSCSSGLHVEKRHYRKGFYVDHSGKKSETVAVKEDLNPEAGLLKSEEQLTVSDSTSAITNYTSANAELLQKHSIPTQEINSEPITSTDTRVLPAEINSAVPPPYDGPVEAKDITILFWVGAGLIGLAILSFVLPYLLMALGVGLIPYFFGGFGIFLLTGIIMEIWVLAVAGERKRQYVNSDPSLSEYYGKLRRRAALILWCLLGLTVLFYVGTILFVIFVVN